MNCFTSAAPQSISRSISSNWLKCFIPRSDPEVRLICLPHAGGAASAYASWAPLLPEWVELQAVQLPGREDRLGEPMISSLPALVRALLPRLLPITDRPWLLFGHSMGAALGYEICQALLRLRQPLPRRLVVSGREAPMLSRRDSLHRQHDDQLTAELVRLEPSMAELLAHSDMRQMILPVVRNDYQLINNYHPNPDDPPLSIDVTAMAGDADEELLPGDVDGWADTTLTFFSQHLFPGRHFYLREQRDDVVLLLTELLSAARGSQSEVP